MDFDIDLPESDPLDYPDPVFFKTHPVITKDFERLGCDVEKLGRYSVITYEGRPFLMFESDTSFTSLLGARLLKDKRATHLLLRRQGLSVADQKVFSRKDRSAALRAVRDLGIAVVKPADGRKGRGVSVGVSEDTFPDAWDAAWAATKGRRILVESCFRGGSEARYLVVDGRCIAVYKCIPPFVRGDGTSSVAQLVERRNAQRERNPDIMEDLILIDRHRLHVLGKQGLALDSIPEAGRAVLIDTKAGLSTGGEAMDITDEVDPALKRIAERVTEILPGLHVIGIDILCRDHSRPPAPEDYIIVEVNTRPGLGGHIFPSYGKPRDVCRVIAESCVDKMKALQPKASGPADISQTLVLGGDTCLGHSYLTERWSEARDRLAREPMSFFEGIAPLLADRDALVINLETVLANDPPDIFAGQKSYLGWDDPWRTTALLKRLGVDAVTLANNHTMDFGPGPLAETIGHLRQAGIAAAGAGEDREAAARPLSFMLGERQVIIIPAFEYRSKYDKDFDFYAGPGKPGVLGFGAEPHWSPAGLIRQHREGSQDALIIFVPHWGGARNYEWANQDMARLASEAIAAGADLVIGHGAHSLQEIDLDPSGSTVFSLGNFIFNSPGRYRAMNGLPFSFICRLALLGSKLEMRLYPVFCDNRVTGFRCRPATGEEATMVFGQLVARSVAPQRLEAAVRLERDERGWCFRNAVPLSPRFG